MSFDESINDLPTNVVSFRDGSSMTLGPGTEFDDFRVLEKLGRGGLGEVWKARDLTGNRDVALKFVPRDIQFHEEEMERVRERPSTPFTTSTSALPSPCAGILISVPI